MKQNVTVNIKKVKILLIVLQCRKSGENCIEFHRIIHVVCTVKYFVNEA